MQWASHRAEPEQGGRTVRDSGQVSRTPREAQFVAVAAAVTPLIFAIVVIVLRKMGIMHENGLRPDTLLEPEVTNTISAVVLVLAALSVPVSIFMRRAMVKGLDGGTDNVQKRLEIALIAMWACCTPAILGLVLAFLTGLSDRVWLVWAISQCGCCLVFPTRAWLEAGIGEHESEEPGGVMTR